MVQERITVDPNRLRGLPCIRDTRVTVSAVLGQLATGGVKLPSTRTSRPSWKAAWAPAAFPDV